MVKKLKGTFILVAVTAVVIVLTLVFVLVNVISYVAVCKNADEILLSLAENGGGFKSYSLIDGGRKPFDGDGFSKETPFETRYFSITYDEDGEIYKIDVGNIAAIDPYKAEELSDSVLEKGRSKGFIGVYRYKVAEWNDNQTLVIFVDCNKQLSICNNLMKISLIVYFVSVACVVLLIIFFSEKAVKPIAESYEKQKRFVTDASHELKTPLTVISANNELIEMEYGESDSTRCIDKQVSKMTSMIKALTMLAKMDEEAQTEENAKFDLSETVLDLLEEYAQPAESKGLTLIKEIQKDVRIIGNERLIRQLISTLMENAVKYGIESIKAVLVENKGTVELTIENKAENLTVGNMDKCFARFYRSDEARASGIEGNGIGLAIAQEIVLLHNGTITAKSIDGSSFTIKVTLKAA